MKSTTTKQRYRMNLFFVARLFVLPPKLIHNRSTSKLIINIRVCKRAIAPVFLGFSPLFCSPWYSRLKTIVKQLFSSGEVNIGEYLPRLRLACSRFKIVRFRWTYRSPLLSSLVLLFEVTLVEKIRNSDPFFWRNSADSLVNFNMMLMVICAKWTWYLFF